MAITSTSWIRGQSGNPTGRPKGSRNAQKKEKFFALLMEGIEKDWEAIIDKQITLAATGDFHATKLLFDHVLPKQKAYIFEKDEEDDFHLEGLDTPEKREKAMNILIEAKSKIEALCQG